MDILVLSPRLTESRRAAFRALARELGELRFVASGEPPPELSDCAAIVVDGPQPARPLQFLAAIRTAVERGAALVAIGAAPVERDGFWADLLGAVAGPEPPPGEYFARRKAAETDFPGVRTYAAVSELVSDDDVEVALVATPPAHHVALTLTLLRAGKHVACEKPLCLTVAEADQIIATAAASRRMLTVHQNRRWDSDFVALRRAVGAGLLGEIFNVETFVGGYAHPCRTWHSDTAVSGGAGYDWGSHHVDWVLQLLTGTPRVVQAHGHKRVWHDVTNHDQIRVRMTWPDGREAEFLQSDIAAVRRPKFYVQGTAGTLVGSYRTITLEHIEPGRGYVATQAHHAEAPADLVLARYESGYGISETRLPPAVEQPFAFHRNLADHLHLGEPLAITPASVRRVISVLEAAQRSSTRGGAAVAIEDDGS